MYELLIVSKISETDGLVGRIEKSLKDVNAQDMKTDQLGKKVLAYPIKKQTEANYTIFTFNAEASSVGDVTSKLRLEQEALLRYLVIVKKAKKLRKKVAGKVEKTPEVKEEKKPKVTVAVKTKTVEKPKAKKEVVNKKSVKKAKK